MAHDGDTDLDHAADEGDDMRAAFELDGGGSAFLEEPADVEHGFIGVPLVGHEGHVGDDDGLRGAPDDGTGVIEDVIHGDGDGAVER